MRTYRAGDTVEQWCGACKIDRLHTVIVVDENAVPVRVQCDHCGSQHNSRGMGRAEGRPPLPAATERERTAPPVRVEGGHEVDLELLLRRIIREETGLTPVVPAEKWRDGMLVLKPGNPSLQEKSWPID